MQDVLDADHSHDGEEYGVLEAENQLHRGAFNERAVVGVVDEEDVQSTEQEEQQHRAGVEQPGNDRRTLHKVHAILDKPMETFEKEQDREQCDESRGKVVSEEMKNGK